MRIPLPRSLPALAAVLNCSDIDCDDIVSFSKCTLTDEQIQRILKTMAAHHFNFPVKDLASEVHAVEAQAGVHRRAATASMPISPRAR